MKFGWVFERLCLGSVLFALTACGGSDDGPAPSPFIELEKDTSFPGSAGDPSQYASLFQFDALSTCRVPNPQDLSVATELRIFKGGTVSDADVGTFLGALQRYYSQYGVTFSARHSVISIPLHELLIFDMEAIAAHVKSETGVDIETTTEADLTEAEYQRVLGAVGRDVMHNVRELVDVYGKPRLKTINVVLLDEMVTRNLPPEMEDFKGIAGFGLSPELLASFASTDPAKALYEWLDLTDDFTPTAIVGVNVVKKYLEHPDAVIAHEVGHAYGLVHEQVAGNLLTQGETSCSVELDDDQLAKVKASLNNEAHGFGVEALSLTSRSTEFVKALSALVVGHRRIVP